MRSPPLYLLAIAILLSACVTTEFREYEGRGNLIEGQGGSKVLVDGMEVWDNGDPPRSFQILGFIQDERPGGLVPMAQLRSDIVKKARIAGGDAVIQAGSQSQIAGYYSAGTATATTYRNSATAFGTGLTMPVRRNSSTFVVIKFVDAVAGAAARPPGALPGAFTGYWSITFTGASAGDCPRLLIDPAGQITGTCRLFSPASVQGQSFTVAGNIDAGGAAMLVATTGASMSGSFSVQGVGGGKWSNGAALGEWRANRN